MTVMTKSCGKIVIPAVYGHIFCSTLQFEQFVFRGAFQFGQGYKALGKEAEVVQRFG